MNSYFLDFYCLSVHQKPLVHKLRDIFFFQSLYLVQKHHRYLIISNKNQIIRINITHSGLTMALKPGKSYLIPDSLNFDLFCSSCSNNC